MSAEDLDAVAVGDAVQLNSGYRRTTEGTVVKIGRTLVHIDNGYGRVDTYRLDGRRRDGYPGGFRTLARVADDERRAAMIERLRGHGVEIRLGYAVDWSTAQLVALALSIEQVKAAIP